MNGQVTAYPDAAYNTETITFAKDAVRMANKKQEDVQQLKVIHTVPAMTETERATAKKRAGKDLYEVFARIKEALNLESELQNS